ncbi:MAG: YbaM family protein [Oceanospirillaceae bacterium]|nr:YbaM family protein [Oceanospirillaceae bacterium]
MSETTLEQAPDHIKLAVDLIQMLEDANISPSTSIQALEIVLQDMRRRLSSASAPEL